MTAWKRSSLCSGGDCVEVDLEFHKSTASWDSANCVETAPCPTCGEVRVRDSKDPDGPVLVFTQAEWDAFIAGAKRGEFDV